MTTAPILTAGGIGVQEFTEARLGAKNIGNEREMQVEFFWGRRKDLNKLKSVRTDHRFGLLRQDITNQQISDKLRQDVQLFLG